MLKKRIIPCLDIKEGRVVKGVNFKGLHDAGDPIQLAEKYVQDRADELVFLDITATHEKRKTLSELVQKISTKIDIPFTVGGGINSLEDAKAIIDAGADKISVNSAAIQHPDLISEIANQLGSQCVVLAIDTKFVEGQWRVYRNGGRVATDWLVDDWAKYGVALGAGEILLTSMNNDGTQAGFAIDITNQISSQVSVPVIASGGAGQMLDFSDLFSKTQATGALAASVFHYDKIRIPELKQYLFNQKIPVR